MGRPETNPYLAPDEVGWHRVIRLTDTDPCFVIDPAFQFDRHIEGFTVQRSEVGQFKGEVFPNTETAAINRRATRNNASVVCDIGLRNEIVEFVE